MTAQNKSFGALIRDGVLGGNPLLRLGLGLCPALAIVTSACTGLCFGIASACVLVLTSLVMGLLGGMLSEKGRAPVALVVSAGFATVAAMIVRGWYPQMPEAFIKLMPLLAVSSLILCRAGHFAAENGACAGLADAVGSGIGYIFALTLIGALRELLGAGTLFGAAVLRAGYEPVLLAVMPAGGLMIAGICMGLANAIANRRGGKGDA